MATSHDHGKDGKGCSPLGQRQAGTRHARPALAPSLTPGSIPQQFGPTVRPSERVGGTSSWLDRSRTRWWGTVTQQLCTSDDGAWIIHEKRPKTKGLCVQSHTGAEHAEPSLSPACFEVSPP